MTILNRLLFATAGLAVWMLTSCSSCSGNWDNKGGEQKSEQQSSNTDYTEAPVNPEVEKIDAIPDEALNVKLVSIKGDSLVVTDEKTGNNLAFSYREAQGRGAIKGSLREGKHYSIFPDNQSKTIEIAINVDELKGQWFYDMQQHRGFKFEERGGLSSINPESISFREWKLLNGKLYIYYVNDAMIASDRKEFLVDEADIMNLSADMMVLNLKGETYQCKRMQKAVEFKMNN